MRATHVVVAALCASIVTACQEPGGPRLGTVVIEVATSGADIDPDGYTVRISGNPSYSQQVGPNAVVRADYILQGKHSVWLDDVAGNCTHASSPVVNVFAVSLAPVTAKFNVACRAYLGSLRVTTTTTGADLDPDGYMVLIQGYSPTVNSNGTVTLSNVVEGSHPLTLADVATNCAISGSNPRPVTIVAASLTQVAFSFTCLAYGQLRVNAVTTGLDLDPNGYVVNVSGPGGNSSDLLPVNGTVTLGQRVAGDDEVRITGVAAGCDFGSAHPRTVTIVSGGIVEVTFQLACVAATQLAYMSSEGDRPGIYTVKSNGGGVTRLTTDNGSDAEPSWSPDGSKIAFSSNRQDNVDVYVMDSTGSGVVRLTNASARDSDPAWSRDGSRIAFVSERDGNFEIYTMNADGSNQTRLTNVSAEDAEPAWSPDGSKIAFRSERDGNSEIYVMNADGSGVTRLTTNGVFDGQPAWSRDGTRLAFTREVPCDYYYYSYVCRRNIHVMNPDGGSVLQLVSESDDVEPSWSPDGSRIAFATWQCDYYGCSYAGLFAMKADGSDVREIVSGAVSRAAWRW